MSTSNPSDPADPLVCPYCKDPMPEKWLTCGQPACRAAYNRNYIKKKRGAAKFKRQFGKMRT